MLSFDLITGDEEKRFKTLGPGFNVQQLFSLYLPYCLNKLELNFTNLESLAMYKCSHFAASPVTKEKVFKHWVKV
jgi:hypothetical protein